MKTIFLPLPGLAGGRPPWLAEFLAVLLLPLFAVLSSAGLARLAGVTPVCGCRPRVGQIMSNDVGILVDRRTPVAWHDKTGH